mgnify:CR=1 FL=1
MFESLSLSAILLTFSLILIIRIVAKFFIKPYVILRRLSKYRGAICKYIPVVGMFGDMMQSMKTHGDSFYNIKQIVKQNPDLRFIASPMGDRIVFELYDLELIKEFVGKQNKMSIKDTQVMGSMPRAVLQGLAFTEGEKWKNQRKVISQVFHFDYMNQCIPSINYLAKKWIESNCEKKDSGVNLHKELLIFTSLVVWVSLFGQDSFEESEEDARKFLEIMIRQAKDTTELIMSPLNGLLGPKVQKLGLRAADRRHARDTILLDEMFKWKLEEIKKKYRERKTVSPDYKPKNFIEILVEESMKPSGTEKFSEAEIMPQVLTFMIAGSETMQGTLNFGHYVLARNPGIQDKIREEIKLYLDETADITYEQLGKMEYLNAFVKELLRMYPTTPILFHRIVTEDTMLGDVKIPKDYGLTINLVGVAHNPKFFDKPEEFRPERWLEKDGVGVKDPMAFLPFSAGSRRCIGEQLVYIETKIMFCQLLRKYRIEIDESYKLRPAFHVIFEPADPIIARYIKL